MKLKNKDKQILEHIIKYCIDIRLAIEHFGKEEELFTRNPVYLNACSMPLLQIGELAKKLSDEFIASSPNIPWRQIKGMRDFFAHDYRSMNKHIIWMTVINNVPALQSDCEKILYQEND